MTSAVLALTRVLAWAELQRCAYEGDEGTTMRVAFGDAIAFVEHELEKAHIQEHGAWRASYANEAFDRAQALATKLNDLDRETGRACSQAGSYSAHAFKRAERIVKVARQ